MQLHHGCDEDCDNNSCNKCLKFYKPENPDDKKCNTKKTIPQTTFVLAGFGYFNQINTKLTFKLYLRIKIGMMFNAKVTFNIIIVTFTGKKYLKTIVNGTGIQNGIAQGSYSENSYMSDFLAIFDCEVNVTEGSHQFLIDNLKLVEKNGEITSIDIPIPNSLSNKDISTFTGNDIENKYGKNNTLYLFIENMDIDRNRLSSSATCTISGNEGIVDIDGTVVRDDLIDNRNFILKTSDDKDAYCILSKGNDTYDANLKCTIENPGRNFFLDEENYKANDESSDYMSFTSYSTSPLCQYYHSINENRKSSLRSKLSSGAIVGIVMVCLIVVIVVALSFLYYYKRGSIFRESKNRQSSFSETVSSSVTNLPIAKPQN